MSRVLGIDYGTKKIGIAVSDEGKKMAFPKTVHPNNWDYFSSFLRDLIFKDDIDEIVVGLPTMLDGNDSELTPEAKEFGEKIKNLTNLPVYFENESFTSSAVDKQGAAPHGKSDASAAALILQSFLDRRNKPAKEQPFSIKL
ncbi:MAG: Holliday junction resolvase RuvX [Patescibacteria group bacterium]